VQLSGFTATDVPATLGPEQAIEAALVLEARAAVGIHHGLFHNPPVYVEQHDALARMHKAGQRRQIEVLALDDGQLTTFPGVPVP